MEKDAIELTNGASFPRRIYGTAIREDEEPPDIYEAVKAGYRVIDTSSTKRRHDEAVDGRQLSQAYEDQQLHLCRNQLFIQTKFTPEYGQGDPLPFTSSDSLRVQVFKSALRSAEELAVNWFDVYFFQYPLRTDEECLEVWKSMEDLREHGASRHLGLCHATIPYLKMIWRGARIKPRFVQNRFTKENNFDEVVLKFCRENNIIYQAFGVFTQENLKLLIPPGFENRSICHGLSRRQILGNLLITMYANDGVKFCIIEGSSDKAHMRENVVDLSDTISQAKSDLALFRANMRRYSKVNETS